MTILLFFVQKAIEALGSMNPNLSEISPIFPSPLHPLKV
jgi:hypothetical protein